MKNNKGISLIVLVITIIVMIILAGTLILSLMNNNILGTASGAVLESDEKTLEEEMNIALVGNGWYKGKNVSTDEFESYLRQIDRASVEKIADDAWWVTLGSANKTIYSDGTIISGKVDTWDGTTEAPQIVNGNWHIKSCEELKFLAEYVNAGSVLTENQRQMVSAKGYNESDYVMQTDTVVYIMNDLDLGARHVNGNLTQGQEWTPIGFSNGDTLIGIFDGMGHTIRGLYINSETSCVGLFATVKNTVKNITIKDGYIKAPSWAGAIAGAGEANMQNCINDGTTIYTTGDLERYGAAGGIVGQYEGIMENCINYGDVSSGGFFVGGLVGGALFESTISNCINYGTVTTLNSAYDIGGIAGISQITSGKIEKCTNNGSIIANGVYNSSSQAGGIVGYSHLNSTIIIDCINNGYIYSKGQWAGGIVGVLAGKVSRCINNGAIESEAYNVAGIIGGAKASSEISIDSCYNRGNIKGKQNIGGIIGKTNSDTTITVSNNYNIGKISVSMETSDLGGIVGDNNYGEYVFSNNYYLQNSLSVPGRNVGEEKTSSEMKSLEFLAQLNNGLEVPVWEFRENENDGYPVIIGLKTK